MDYQAFLSNKLHYGAKQGFEPTFYPSAAFDFQNHLIHWLTVAGRGAVFADCGLGKTLVQLSWLQNMLEHTNKPVLLLTPLAVAAQTVKEGQKFGIDVCRSESIDGAKIYVTNYERLHLLNKNDFAAVALDESSILKNFNGKRKAQITEFMRTIQYRALFTATAAPNDYTELGTSSEALGNLGHMDMLGRFFRNDQNNTSNKRHYASQSGGSPKWRFKGHAENAFWQWVCSWARACRKPSDLGFDDSGFVLPPLIENEHIIDSTKPLPGRLFAMPAVGLKEQREERRHTIAERVEKAASIVADTGEPAIMWCHMNAEGEQLQKMIKDSVQVSGSQTDEQKENAYASFINGDKRVLIVKPKIGAWGLNFQHCNHMVSFASHSFEQDYQQVRRCWRFGQKRTVTVDRVSTESERGITANLQHKAAQADKMFANLVANMNNAISIDKNTNYPTKVELPKWL